MKTCKLLLILCFVFTIQTQAKKIPGIIITETDTLEVVFKIPFLLFGNEPNYPKIQEKLSYYSKNGMLTNIYPKDLKEVQFSYLNKVNRLILFPKSSFSTSPFPSKKNIFVRIICDGDLKLYKYYATSIGATTDGMPYRDSDDKNVLQKGNGALTRVRYMDFKNFMSGYLHDCPQVVKKIQKRELRHRHLISIVKEYNKNCGS